MIVTEIYSAGERPLPDLDGSVVADALTRHGHLGVLYEPDPKRIRQRLSELLQPGDILLTLGAGDVWKIGDALVRSTEGGAVRSIEKWRAAR